MVRAHPGGKRLAVLIPTVAVIAIVYTLWVNVFPVQPGAYAVLPWVVLGWIAIPVIATIARPGMVRDVDEGRTALQAEPPTR